MTEVDARRLVEAHQAGDEAAFTRIASLAYPSLYQHARRRLGDHHAAEDAVQETFVRAFRALPRFEGDFRLQAWLHRILTNVCFDEGARRGRDVDMFSRASSLREDSMADPADLTIVADARASVTAALAELPDRYRDAVALRYLDDLSYHEVALATGVSEQNARARVSRGCAALRRAMGQGAAGLLVVFPFLRRGHRAAIAADGPALAPSTALSEHVGPVLVNSAASPLTNVSAQIAGHVVQAAPAVSRLAEVSVAMTDGRSTGMAKAAGAIAAMMVPAAYTFIASPPAQPPAASVVVDAGTDPAEVLTSITTTTSTVLLSLPLGATSTSSTSSTTSTTTPVVVGASRELRSRPPAVSDPAPTPIEGVVADPATTGAEPEAVPTEGRHAGIASDELRVVREGSRFRLWGPIGFATADKDKTPSGGQIGELSGDVYLQAPAADGKQRASAVLELEIDDRSYTLRLEGRIVDVSSVDGATTYQLVGTYRLMGASELGIDEQGDVSATLVVADEAPDGRHPELSGLRLDLGVRPPPVEGDAG